MSSNEWYFSGFITNIYSIPSCQIPAVDLIWLLYIAGVKELLGHKHSREYASFCICDQPMRDDVTLYRRLLLARRMHKNYPCTKHSQAHSACFQYIAQWGIRRWDRKCIVFSPCLRPCSCNVVFSWLITCSALDRDWVLPSSCVLKCRPVAAGNVIWLLHMV